VPASRVYHQHLTVKVKQHVQDRIAARLLHVSMLSDADNISKLSEFRICLRRLAWA
jgi:hypothetical protein